MKKLLLICLMISACSTTKPVAKPTPEFSTPKLYRVYKETLSNCITYVLDNPSNDVLRFAKADDPAVGKVMDGEILKCLDFNMELIYEPK